MSERFCVLCTIAPLVARLVDDLAFTPTADGQAIQYEGPLPDNLLATYPKVPGYEVTRVAAPAPAPLPAASPPPAPAPSSTTPEADAQVRVVTETKVYADGSQATGPGPLPDQSTAEQAAATSSKVSKAKGGKTAA